VERSLIHAIEEVLTDRSGRISRWTGDDASVVRSRPFAVTSIDSVAQDVHFRAGTPPRDVGWRALATALSDIAAMGAEAGEAYVSLALPAGYEGALELVEGMEELAGRCGATIAGGDVIRAPALVVTVAVTGWADAEEELAGRDGARPGDLVGVTGALGGSEAARLLVERGAEPPPDALRRHLRPEPLLAAGRALAAAGVTSMIDLSDGLATDAAHVAARSGAELRLRLADLPLAAGVDLMAGDPRVFAATGGDDYELLVTAPPERVEDASRAAEAAGTTLTWLGDVTVGLGLVLLDENGDQVPGLEGYEHA